jgi:hypothetical protein
MPNKLAFFPPIIDTIPEALSLLESISGYEWAKKGLPKTGQKTQYGGYPDDGFYEKGVANNYTVLTADQYGGTVNIVLHGKTDIHLNECVIDNRNGLMWSRYPAASVGPTSNGKLPWTTNSNGEGIYPFVAAANLAGLGGYNDWRTPNDIELINLRVMEAPTAVPNAVAFPGWPTNGYFWSSTTEPHSVGSAMVVDFSYGNVRDDVKTIPYFVALVRGGPQQ